MKKALRLLIALFLATVLQNAEAYEVKKSALYVFLHEVKPTEEEGAKALKDENYALALRKYREALRGYERLCKDFPDLPEQRPRGIDRMVDESMEICRKVIEEIKEKGEEQDKFHQQLSQMVQVDFTKQDIYDVAKSLTFITDVNIIVDETVFESNELLNPYVDLRNDNPIPLKQVIQQICQQTGLAYSIEENHVFISTRVKLDQQK